MPKESCVHKMIKLIFDESIPYAESCTGACFMNFLLFLLHFTMYTGGKKEEDEKIENRKSAV